jgi:hypothetical protein
VISDGTSLAFTLRRYSGCRSVAWLLSGKSINLEKWGVQMKYILGLLLVALCGQAFGAGKCRLTTVDGTWEFIGAPEVMQQLPGGMTVSTEQGVLQVAAGRVIGGKLSQLFIMADGSSNLLPAALNGGQITLDTTTCRISAEIDSGVSVMGMPVPMHVVGRGEYSRVARAIVGRAVSLTTGGRVTFLLRRPAVERL